MNGCYKIQVSNKTSWWCFCRWFQLTYRNSWLYTNNIQWIMSMEKCVSYTDVIIMGYGNEHINQQVRKDNWTEDEPFPKIYVSNIFLPIQMFIDVITPEAGLLGIFKLKRKRVECILWNQINI